MAIPSGARAHGNRWSAQVAARIVGMSVAPLLHQLLKLGVVPVRQDNFCGDEKIAAAACFRQTLALEAEDAAAGGVFRDRQFHRAAERGHTDLAAEHGLV